MALYEPIIKRCSVRSYSDKIPSNVVIDAIREKIGRLKPLDNTIRIKLAVVNAAEMAELTGTKKISQAPYYIVAYSENKGMAYQNIGFLLEQLVLNMTAMGLGVCYLGGLSVKNTPPGFIYIITLAFGIPKGSLRQGISEFKRRPLESLCRGEQPDETVSQIIMAARLAPSAMNLQPCRYQIEGHKIHIFRGSPPLAIKKFVKLQQIDCGIAMAHIMEQAKFMGIHGKFCKMDNIKTGGTYEMSVILDSENNEDKSENVEF